MKRILFINDTGLESNPGCRAVAATLRARLRERADDIDSIPLGYWSDEFRGIDEHHRRAFRHSAEAFPSCTPSVPDVSLKRWEQIRHSCAENDTLLRDRIDNADCVVINGEGSIHHNFPRGLAILALALTCVERRKPVHLVNCTIQAMSISLLAAVLPRLSLLHVREPRTFDELKQLPNLPLRLSADVAFASEFSAHVDPSSEDRSGQCLLTSGVGAHPRFLPMQVQAIRDCGWEPRYLFIGDAGERAVAEDVCRDCDVEVVRAETIPWSQFPDYLGSYPVAVSGRHHINIFLMHAGVPFVPLPSNTWKIEETLRFVEYPVRVATTEQELRERLAAVSCELRTLQQAARRAANAGTQRVRSIFL